jgi:hypothetical protein
MCIPLPMVEEPYISISTEVAFSDQMTVIVTPAVDVGSSSMTNERTRNF